MPHLQSPERLRDPRPRNLDLFFVSQRSKAKTVRQGQAKTSEGRNGSLSASAQSTSGAREDLSNLQRDERVNAHRTTSTSLIESRARKNLIDAKSRKRFSICRLLNTRCSRGDCFSERPGAANFTSCISSMSRSEEHT